MHESVAKKSKNDDEKGVIKFLNHIVLQTRLILGRRCTHRNKLFVLLVI